MKLQAGILAWVALSGLLTGCATDRVIVTGSNVPTEAVVNAWTTFSRAGDEVRGVGMYTYVLFGRRVDKKSSPEVYKLYETLLNEIADTTYKVDPSEPEDWGKFNVFHVPTGISASPDKPLISQYNYVLAKSYLNKLTQTIKVEGAAARLQSEAGPFLITTMKPLPQMADDSYVLYANLSDLHPKAVSELVREYKMRVSTRRIERDEAFGPIKISVLSGILKAQDDLAIAKITVPAWIHFGEKKKE